MKLLSFSGGAGQKYSEGIFLFFTEENGMLALCASLLCLKLLAVSSLPPPPCPASPLLPWLTPLLLSPALLSWVLPSLVSGHCWVLLWVLKPSSRREIQKGVTKRLGVASHPWFPACCGTCHGRMQSQQCRAFSTCSVVRAAQLTQEHVCDTASVPLMCPFPEHGG